MKCLLFWIPFTATGLFSTALFISVPRVIGNIVNSLVIGKSPGEINVLGLLLILVTLVFAASEYCHQVLLAGAIEKVAPFRPLQMTVASYAYKLSLVVIVLYLYSDFLTVCLLGTMGLLSAVVAVRGEIVKENLDKQVIRSFSKSNVMASLAILSVSMVVWISAYSVAAADDLASFGNTVCFVVTSLQAAFLYFNIFLSVLEQPKSVFVWR
ncbi:MAG: hypothetical protein AAF268_11870 [Cyanobacteria bacterium P01_A01_bin.3]